MKKTLIAVICAVFVSSGAFAAQPSHAPKHHNDTHVVHQVHKPAPKVEHHHQPKPAPAPHFVEHHHHYHHTDLGDVLIAFAILATSL